jgi:thioredoxin 1
MKTLIAVLILTLGVTSVTSMADVQAMAAKPAGSTGRSQASQFSTGTRRANSDRQSSSRHITRPEPRPQPVTPAPERQKAPAVVPVAPKAPTPDVNAGWIKCPCDNDCKCPTEQVCKNGECKKNYVVMFTAKWCTACPRMKKVLDQLGAEGYIVYFVDTDEEKDKKELFKITTLPTVVVMDNGKEVRRLVGISAAEAVTEGLKKRSQQITTDYNFLD